MNEYLKENNYVAIDNFLTEQEAKELYETFRNDSTNQSNLFTHDSQCPLSLAKYDYRWFVNLLVARLPVMHEVMGELMLPTYSYARVYANGEVLEKHIDRPACEVSVSLHLGSDGTEWPIYFTKPNGETIGVEMKPGQAVIYLGMISEHWRNEFKGEHYGQVFLHYVKAQGEHWNCYFDKKAK